MSIIAIEGLDKSGKATQANILTQRLTALNINAVQSEFHRYDTITGKIIKDYLMHNIEMDNYTIELIMAADKQNQMDYFKKLFFIDKCEFLILDRYTSSQFVYAISKGIDRNWIDNLLSNIIAPSIEILIDIPVKDSMKRKGKFGDNDRYESDKEFLTKVRNNYLELFNSDDLITKRIVIDGTASINEVSDNIWNFIKNVYKF